MESSNSYSDPHASAAIQIVTYDMENKSTPTMEISLEKVRTLLNLDLRKKADCTVANETLAAHIAHVGERLTELRGFTERP